MKKSKPKISNELKAIHDVKVIVEVKHLSPCERWSEMFFIGSALIVNSGTCVFLWHPTHPAHTNKITYTHIHTNKTLTCFEGIYFIPSQSNNIQSATQAKLQMIQKGTELKKNKQLKWWTADTDGVQTHRQENRTCKIKNSPSTTFIANV